MIILANPLLLHLLLKGQQGRWSRLLLELVPFGAVSNGMNGRLVTRGFSRTSIGCATCTDAKNASFRKGNASFTAHVKNIHKHQDSIVYKTAVELPAMKPRSF